MYPQRMCSCRFRLGFLILWPWKMHPLDEAFLGRCLGLSDDASLNDKTRPFGTDWHKVPLGARRPHCYENSKHVCPKSQYRDIASIYHIHIPKTNVYSSMWSIFANEPKARVLELISVMPKLLCDVYQQLDLPDARSWAAGSMGCPSLEMVRVGTYRSGMRRPRDASFMGHDDEGMHRPWDVFS